MKLNSIQVLRAVAALLVVYEHSMAIQIHYGNSWQQHFLHVKNFGCIGVDLFFVISGFIITLIASNYTGTSQGVQFLAKRFFRINPIYYILTLVYLPFIYFNISITSSDLSLNSIFDSLLILPISGHSHTYKPLLILGWTLSFEWLFYLLFYILILLDVRQKVFYLMGIIVLLVVFGYIFHPNDFRLIFITNPIMLEFLLGCIICYIYLTVKQIPADIGFVCLLIGVGCYIYLIIQGFGNVGSYIGTINGNLSLYRFLFWGIPSSMIVAGCVILEKNGQFSSMWNNQFSVLCGDASYSIYLVHLIVLNLLTLLYYKTGYFLPTDMMIWLQLIVAVAVSVLFYKLVEKPLLQFMNKGKFMNTRIVSNHKTLTEEERDR